MNRSAWVLQVLLAIVFLAHGWILLVPPASIVEQLNATLPRWFQLFLGIAEISGAVGLILPAWTRVMPWLVAWAAAGIVIVMISATVLHIVRGETTSTIVTLVLLAMAAFVAYVRWRVLPIGGEAGRGAIRQPDTTRVS